MVANDDSTLGSYLDIDSLTLESAEQNSQSTADTIAKAIMWNHGFMASDMVLRTHLVAKQGATESPLSRGLADATKYLDGGQPTTWKVGGMENIKHGNIVALCVAITNHHFLRLKSKKVCFGGGGRSSPTDLPRNWDSERFLVIQKGENFALYSIAHNTYMKETDRHLCGIDRDVHLDTPRFCELFSIVEASVLGSHSYVNLKTPSGGYVVVTKYNGMPQSLQTNGKESDASKFQVVLLSDAFST